MCIKVLHLRKDLTGNITLPENCFYIGGAFLNLPQSQLYKDLNTNQYKQWLWNEIKAKTNTYQQLSVITNSIILGNDVILACSCGSHCVCNGLTIKKAIRYLVEQEKLSAQAVEPSSWEEYKKVFFMTQDKLHDFAVWLTSNSYYEDKLNFYELWISFIYHRHIA